MKLSQLPEHMRTKEWIEPEIHYEMASGIHTYHWCECGRRQTRSEMCLECWLDCLEELTGSREYTPETEQQRKRRERWDF